MKILVTGHQGYIGSKLYETLLTKTRDVVGIDLKEGQDIINCLPDEDFDYVFHTAALPRVGYSVENPSYTLKHNVYATSVLLEWAKNHNVRRLIFSSSSAIMGDGHGPTSPYGLHKLMAEKECRLYSQLYGLDTVCLRYFNVFSHDQPYGGSYSTVVCAWIQMINNGKDLRIDGDGEQSRDFIHVDDVVDVNTFCMERLQNFNGEHYDVGTGHTISLNEIKKIVAENNKVNFITSPPRPGDVRRTKADIEKLKSIGWAAIINPLSAIHSCFNNKEI